MINAINTLDITISGEPTDFFVMPKEYNAFDRYQSCKVYWHSYEKPIVKTINLVNVESFSATLYPIVKYEITPKTNSRFKKWFWEGFPKKLFDIKRIELGEKQVTWVKMRSNEKFCIDESVEYLKNAIDACVWTADFLCIK